MPLMQVVILTDTVDPPAASLAQFSTLTELVGRPVVVAAGDEAGLWSAVDAAAADLIVVVDGAYTLIPEWWLPVLIQLEQAPGDPVAVPVQCTGSGLSLAFPRTLASDVGGRARLRACFEEQRRRGEPVTDGASERISVLTPTFNRLTLLPRALESLTKQTHTDFEVVIVNDGGLDPSKVIEPYHDLLDIRLVTLPANFGRAATYNVGLNHCSSRLVTFLADDDTCQPGHLANLLGAIGSGTAPAFTYGAMYAMSEDGDGKVGMEAMWLDGERSASYLMVENFVSGASLFDRDAALSIGGFDETFEVMEDWDFWIRMSQRCEMRFVRRPTYEYRLRFETAGNAFSSSGIARFFKSQQRIYERYPVAPGSLMERLRQERIEAQRAKQEDTYPYDRAIGVVGNGDVDELIACIRSIAEAAAEGDERVQIIVHDVRTPQTEAALASLTVDMVCLSNEFNPEHAVNRIAMQAGAPKIMVIGSNERF